jgi:predicted site-specific integrase-resolvase
MSLGKTWYTLAEAVSIYRLDTSLVLKWVEEGVIRAEPVDNRAMRVNVEDLAMKVHKKAGI